MLVTALKSFSGLETMSKGQTKEITDKATLDDLMRAGYIEPAAKEAEVVKKSVEKPTKPVEKKKK